MAGPLEVLRVTLSLLVVWTGWASCSTCTQAACRHSKPACLDKLSRHNELLGEMLNNYDNYLRPTFSKGTATSVTCDVYINSFDSISVDTMVGLFRVPLISTEDYSVNIYMRQRWKDERLAFGKVMPNASRISLDYKLFDEIWVPDIFFPNEKASHTHCVTVPNSMIRIYPDGSILYSARYTLRLACHMALQSFPFDRQECHMRIESYGYTIDEIRLFWKNETAVQINENLELPQFDLLDEVKTGECTGSYIIGEFSCLEATFRLRRQYGYYMIQTYVPSILIVTLSWVSFWINIDAVPARISLGVLTVLTLTTQSVGVWMSLPRVSYVKAIDTWMAMCIILVFAAMVEFAVVNTLARKEIRRMTIKKAQEEAMGKEGVEGIARFPADLMKRMMDEHTYGSLQRFDPESRMMARRVDKIARWAFPASFVIFNVIYWTLYLS